MKSPSVSLIIPNWNGLDHLKDCLEAVARQSVRPQETILVDNGSTDDSFEYVRRNFPEVHLIGLSKNFGFAYAVNRGIEAARGEFIALLNNDTDLDTRWLEMLVSALETDPQLGSVACRMLNFYDRSFIDSAGDALSRFGSPYGRGSAQKADAGFGERELVFGACAGAALYRQKMFLHVGLFDEEFISYYEDIDLSFRAQMAGFKCLYVPEAICYHKRGATSGIGMEYPIRMGERNLTAFQVKDFPLAMLVPKFPMIVASRIRRMYRSARAGWGRATLSGFIEGFTLVPSMLKKRRKVQRLRVVSIGYLNSLLKRPT